MPATSRQGGNIKLPQICQDHQWSVGMTPSPVDRWTPDQCYFQLQCICSLVRPSLPPRPYLHVIPSG